MTLIYTQGGGGSGTSDYNQLSNKPKIENVTLSGNKSLADLGIASINALSDKQDTLVSGTNIKTINGNSILGEGNIEIEGGGAVDSVNGKTGVVVLTPSDVGAATAAQGAKADSALQSGDNISELINDANYASTTFREWDEGE